MNRCFADRPRASLYIYAVESAGNQHDRGLQYPAGLKLDSFFICDSKVQRLNINRISYKRNQYEKGISDGFR
jgi:hypothetical protein